MLYSIYSIYYVYLHILSWTNKYQDQKNNNIRGHHLRLQIHVVAGKNTVSRLYRIGKNKISILLAIEIKLTIHSCLYELYVKYFTVMSINNNLVL